MTKWEYKTVSDKGLYSDSDFGGKTLQEKWLDRLNLLGNEGWELTNTLLHGTEILAYFKRPKKK